MKGNNGKKLLAGLASSLIFFGKNVYAVSDTTSSSSSGGKTILLVGGLALILAILGLSYKMDKNADKEPKEIKEPKAKKEKKTKKEKKQEKVETKKALNDNDVPYEAEKDEKYEPEKAEVKSIQDEVEDTEFEEESLFPSKNSAKSNFDSTMVFNMNEDSKEDEISNEEENSEYEIGDLNQKIDELDDLDDIDDEVVNKKMAELEKSNNEVENPQDFLNNLKKYEQDADDFAGFSTKEENNNSDDEEVTSFSFGNTNTTNVEENKTEHKKYTRKKVKEDKVEETVNNTKNEYDNTDRLSAEIDDLPDITFTHEEDNKKEEVVEDEEEPKLDIGFLNQMEQNLMKNQAERMNKTAEKTKKDSKEKTTRKKK